jgi:hypothetical protein
MPRIRERSITRPSSTVHSPGPLWPPPRTASAIFWLRAKLTEAMTSATSTQRTMIAGRRSIIPL